MQSKLENSPSPNKRNSFRSRTKLKQGQTGSTAAFQSTIKQPKTVNSYKMYMKQFPLGMAEDVVRIIQSFEPIHTNFVQNLDNLKLYKSGLASQFENNWAEFMDVLRVIIVKLNKRTQRMVQQKQAKIVQLLNINSQKQQEIQKIKDKLDNIENLRQLEKAQLAVANNQVEMVNREMADIYTLMQADMGKVLKYLTSIDQAKKLQTKNGTQKLYNNLEDFTTLLNSMQAQQKQTSVTLNSMREMIKAMARSTKTNTGTQVDESQLQTQAANIFSNANKEQTYQTLDATALNAAGFNQYQHTLDKLKLKEKDHNHQTYHPKRSLDKPWALTPTLLIFLENMSKENEAGRVLPWQYMKNLIAQIYEQRIKAEHEMISGMVGNAMLFDEFVVFYFLKKFKIRRLAQVKLLEFIISLKYYSKFWIKAQTFCCLLDVMKFIPLSDPSDTYNYKMDYYTQNFFFQVYKRMINFDLIQQEDGTVYVATKKVKKLMKLMLFFTDDMSKSRLYVKLEKDIRIFDKVQCADFDFAMFLFLQEFFAVRKKNSHALSRQFAKLTEKVQGYVSIDELLNIFNQFSKLYNSGQQFPQKYPVQSPLHISKLYLYAITSGKNDYQMSSPHFVQACQRYGFDSPFPFLHTCIKPSKHHNDNSIAHISSQQLGNTEQHKDSSQYYASASNQAISQYKSVQPNENAHEQKQQKKHPVTEIKQININQERIDVGAKLFSQHFSLLKEMKDYVEIFSQTLIKEKDPDVLWKSFNQIKAVLEKGCHFMNYPLIGPQDAKKMK